MEQITYQKLWRWKYRLVEDYQVHIGFFETKAERGNDFVWLDHGLLTIRKGYAWDGPSGPTVDTPNWMRGSLVHDALYQLMREGHLPPEMRKKVDLLMHSHLVEDGMSRARARLAYWGVRAFGAKSARERHEPKVRTAP
jgi:hypothetical protein